MLRIGRDHEGPWLDRQQVVFLHEPHHPFVIDLHPAPMQVCRDAPRTLSTPMGDGALLHGRPHRHLFV
jgi:hypothetical protein